MALNKFKKAHKVKGERESQCTTRWNLLKLNKTGNKKLPVNQSGAIVFFLYNPLSKKNSLLSGSYRTVFSSFPSTERLGFRPTGGCIRGLSFPPPWEKVIPLLIPMQTCLESRNAKLFENKTRAKIERKWSYPSAVGRDFWEVFVVGVCLPSEGFF